MAYPDSSQDVPPRANVARESDAPSAVEAATSRLLAALDALEAAVEHSQVAEAAIASSLHAAAERIERVTKTLNQSLGEEAALG